MEPEQNKKNFNKNISELPIQARKKIFYSLIFLCVIVVVILGYITFRFGKYETKKDNIDWDAIKKQVESAAQYTQYQLGEIKDVTTQTTQQVQKQADTIQKFEKNNGAAAALMDKVIQEKTDGWKLLTDEQNGYLIKIPAQYTFATTTATSTGIIAIIYEGAKSVAATISKTNNEPGEQTAVLQFDNYFLTLSDFRNTTTTELITYTFKKR